MMPRRRGASTGSTINRSASSGTPSRLPQAADLATIIAAQPLVLPAEGSAVRADFDRLMAREGLAPKIAAEADDMAMLRLLVRENTGLALVPPIVVQDELEAGQLVEALRLPDLHEAFWAITLPRRFPNPALARILSSN